MKQQIVICDYCNRDTVLVTGATVYPENPKTHGKHYWYCAPCDAWSACHENSQTLKPVGRLANMALREAKKAAIDAFDLLWMAGHQRMLRKRGEHARKQECIGIAYGWLAEQMGITGRCHFGSFSLEQCIRAREICVKQGNDLLMRFANDR